jgi:hypothetical protein
MRPGNRGTADLGVLVRAAHQRGPAWGGRRTRAFAACAFPVSVQGEGCDAAPAGGSVPSWTTHATMGQDVIADCSLLPVAISILRGLAFSATGMVSLSTPAS